MPRKALLQIRRGLKAQLPTLVDGELGFCTDTEELYVGTTNGNKCIGTGADMFKSVYDTNNNGKVDNAEKADSVPWTGVTGKPNTFAPSSHSHKSSELPQTFQNMTDGASNLPYRKDIIVYGDSDKYYPVHFAKGNQNLLRTIKIWRAYSEQAPSDWYTSTHKGSLNLVWLGNYGAWGGAAYREYILENSSQYTVLLADCKLVDNSYAYAFYLRGGGVGGAIYHIASDQPLDWTDNNLTYTEPTAFYNQDLTFNHSNEVYKRYAGAPLTSVNTTRIKNMTLTKFGDIPSIKVNNASTADTANAVAWTNVSGKPGAFTPTSHGHGAADLPSASTSAKGVVQLSSSTSSTSTSLAATPSAVKAAYDLANGKWTYNEATIKAVKVNNAGTADVANSVTWANVSGKPTNFTPTTHSHGAADLPSASTSAKGVVQLSSSTSSTSTTLAATPSAVKAAYDLANGKWTYNENTIKGVKVNNAVTADSANAVAWANVSSKPAQATRWPTWSEVTGKPTTFTPATHSHRAIDLTAYGPGLEINEDSLLAVEVDWNTIKINPYDAGSRGKLYVASVPWGSVTGKPSSFAPTSHKHVLADITDYVGGGGGSIIDQGFYTGNGASYRSISFPKVTDPCVLFIYAQNGSAGGGANGLYMAVYTPLQKSQIMSANIRCIAPFDSGGIGMGTTVGSLEITYFQCSNVPALNKSGNYYEWVVIGN